MLSTLVPSSAPKVSRELARTDPFDFVSPFGLTFGRLFDDFWSERGSTNGGSRMLPALDVTEDANAITIAVEVPGVRKEDVKVEFDNGVVTISGEKKSESEEKGSTFHRLERRYGAFVRSLTLPASVNCDTATAETRDGVLRITLPKREEAKAKSIKIK